MNARLAWHAATRVLHPVVAVALVAAALALLPGGEASALASAEGLRDEAARAAARIASAWSAFLALVAPLLVLRAARVRSRGEVAWALVSRTSLARAEASRAAGAVAAALLVVAAWSAYVAAGTAPGATPLAPAGSAAGPTSLLLAHDAPLAWRADVPDEPGLVAGVGVSLSIAPGAGGAVRFLAARAADPGTVAVGVAHLQPRGVVEVAVPRGAGPVDFRVELAEPDARGFLASREVELLLPAPVGAPAARLAQRAALLVAAWTLIAFGLGAWLRSGTVLALLFAAWAACWTLDGPPAWIVGSGFVADLARVESGRAPAPIAVAEVAGLAGSAVAALLLSRRRPEARP